MPHKQPGRQKRPTTRPAQLKDERFGGTIVEKLVGSVGDSYWEGKIRTPAATGPGSGVWEWQCGGIVRQVNWRLLCAPRYGDVTTSEPSVACVLPADWLGWKSRLTIAKNLL